MPPPTATLDSPRLSCPGLCGYCQPAWIAGWGTEEREERQRSVIACSQHRSTSVTEHDSWGILPWHIYFMAWDHLLWIWHLDCSYPCIWTCESGMPCDVFALPYAGALSSFLLWNAGGSCSSVCLSLLLSAAWRGGTPICNIVLWPV